MSVMTNQSHLNSYSTDIPAEDLGSEPVQSHKALISEANLAVCLKTPPQQACDVSETTQERVNAIIPNVFPTLTK